MFRRISLTIAAAVPVVAVLSGCTSTAPQGGAPGGGPIEVTASDSACSAATTTAPAGQISFTIHNTGSKVTEFYLYAAGDRILGEVENVGAGLTRALTVEVPDGGAYTTACKPGMVGDGIRGPFTVTGNAARQTDQNRQLAAATAGYTRYVASQSEALTARTTDFANAVKAGNVEQAKALFPVARTYYERIEPIAGSFGDLDPRLDAREDDQRDPGVPWKGFHRLEKDLWVAGLTSESPAVADALVTDVKDLQARVRAITLTPVQMANGAKSLLDEVATGKITGEEDRYSHTDLYDFRANVEGSRTAVAALRPVIDQKNAELGKTLDQRFDDVDRLLAGYRQADGFRLYTSLNAQDKKKMSTSLDALSEPVSQVAGAITT